MELVFVRHGEPEWYRDGLNVGDPPLTELGHEQALRMAESLATESFHGIYVSPLVRARQTAAPLLARVGLPEQVEPWLEEIRNPAWHGTPAERAEEAFRAERAMEPDDRWHGIPGGEPPREFVARIRRDAEVFFAGHGVTRAHDRLPVWAIDEPGRRLAFVAHGGTNAVLICFLLGLEPVPWEWDRLVLGHASVSRLEALEVGGGFTFSLTRLSDMEHLSTAQRTR